MRTRTFTFTVMLASLILALFPQVSEAFSFSPDRMFVEVSPGHEQRMMFTIQNETKSATRAHVVVQAFMKSGETGKPLFTDEKLVTSIEPFVILSANDIALKAGESRPYAFTMKVPKTATPGSYFGAIHIAIGSVEGGNTAVAVTGPLVFLTIPGSVAGAASIAISSVSLPTGTLTALPDGFGVTIRNDGSLVEVPTGTVRIRNFVGGITREYSLNEAGAALLPGDERSFQIGESVVSDASFMNDLTNFGLGPYSVDVHVDAEHVATVEMKGKTFWILPWRVLGAAAVFSLLAAMILAFVFPRRQTSV